jgi:hypothetical protein
MWKKPIWKGYTLYNLNVWHSGKDTTMEKVKRSVVAIVSGVERDE